MPVRACKSITQSQTVVPNEESRFEVWSGHRINRGINPYK
jgi:hypothetical protein